MNPVVSAESFRRSESSASGKAKAWVLGFLVFITYSPLLFLFFSNLWKFDVHRFFPMALLGSAILAWRGLHDAPCTAAPGCRIVTVCLSLLSLGLLWCSMSLWSPWMCMLSTLSAIVTVIWWLGGSDLLKPLLPAVIMLASVIPPPLNLESQLALSLQHWSVAGSSRVLALMGVPHLRSGNLLEVPTRQLLVAEACSGINSLLFMASACVFYVLWRRRPLGFIPAIYAMTIGVILAGNLMRISFSATLLYFGIDLFTGWKHEAVGLVLTGSYLLFIVLADALLARILRLREVLPLKDRIGTQGNHAPASSAPLLFGILRNRLTAERGPVVVIVAAFFIAVFQAPFSWTTHPTGKAVHHVNPASMDGKARFSMPAEIEGWRLVSQEKPMPIKTAYEDGVYSHVWKYEKGGVSAVLALDYPFYDYHDVRTCYVYTGWQVTGSKLHKAVEHTDGIPEMEVELSKAAGLKGCLFYSTVNENGTWMEEIADRGYYESAGNGLNDRDPIKGFFARISQRSLNNVQQSPNYRIQVLAAAQAGLSTKQHDQLLKLFTVSRKLLSNQFVVRSKPTTTTSSTPMAIPSEIQSSGNQAPPATLPSIQNDLKGSDLRGNSFR